MTETLFAEVEDWRWQWNISSTSWKSGTSHWRSKMHSAECRGEWVSDLHTAQDERLSNWTSTAGTVVCRAGMEEWWNKTPFQVKSVIWRKWRTYCPKRGWKHTESQQTGYLFNGNLVDGRCLQLSQCQIWNRAKPDELKLKYEPQGERSVGAATADIRRFPLQREEGSCLTKRQHFAMGTASL